MRDLQSLIKQDILDAGGWCDNKKRFLIHNLIQISESKKCLEIGVYKGSSLLCFAEALEKINGKIIGIDPWSFELSINDIPDKEYSKYIYDVVIKDKQNTFDLIYEDLKQLIINNNLSNTIELIKQPSYDAFLNFDVNTFDVIHIDGNHDEINVSKDILLYLPTLKKGGYIIMDDSNWESVKNAINKYLLTSCKLIEDFGGYSYYKKIL